jgi:hypothetical protein
MTGGRVRARSSWTILAIPKEGRQLRSRLTSTSSPLPAITPRRKAAKRATIVRPLIMFRILRLWFST